MTTALLYGGAAKVRAMLAVKGVADDRDAERFVTIVKRMLNRDALASAVAFTHGAAVSLDGGVHARPPPAAGLTSAAADAAWSRTGVNVLVAGLSSAVCRAALVALHGATTLGVSAGRADALRAAAPECAAALVAAAGGFVRLDASLTWWLHDGFYLVGRRAAHRRRERRGRRRRALRGPRWPRARALRRAAHAVRESYAP